MAAAYSVVVAYVLIGLGHLLTNLGGSALGRPRMRVGPRDAHLAIAVLGWPVATVSEHVESAGGQAARGTALGLLAVLVPWAGLAALAFGAQEIAGRYVPSGMPRALVATVALAVTSPVLLPIVRVLLLPVTAPLAWLIDRSFPKRP